MVSLRQCAHRHTPPLHSLHCAPVEGYIPRARGLSICCRRWDLQVKGSRSLARSRNRNIEYVPKHLSQSDGLVLAPSGERAPRYSRQKVVFEARAACPSQLSSRSWSVTSVSKIRVVHAARASSTTDSRENGTSVRPIPSSEILITNSSGCDSRSRRECFPYVPSLNVPHPSGPPMYVSKRMSSFRFNTAFKRQVVIYQSLLLRNHWLLNAHNIP